MSRLNQILNKKISKIVIDVSLLVGFIVEFITREGPNYNLHSWVGVILIPIIAFHLLSNTRWIKRIINRGKSDPEFNLAILNSSLGMLAGVCIVTGFPLWFEWNTSSVLSGIHTFTGMLSLLIMIAHIFKNKSRIKALLR